MHAAVSAPEKYDTVWERIMQEQSQINMQKGYALLEAGYYPESVNEFAKAAVENPGNAQTHIMLGTALYWAGQIDAAMLEFSEGLKINPTNAQAHQLMGIAHAWKGDTAAAFAEFSEAEKLAPQRADIHMDLGSIYESMGNADSALRHFRQAAGLDPDNPLYHFQLGSLYSRLGRDTDAEESFENAVKKYGRYEDAILELAAVKERLGLYKNAAALYRRAISIKPMDSVARFRLALLLVKEGNTAEAVEILRDAFRLLPNKGESIGLSLAYSGTNNAPQDAGELKPLNKPRSGPLEPLLKNLEKIPLNQESRVQVELFYLPKPELVIAKPKEGSSLKNALEKAEGPLPKIMGARREFMIPVSDSKTRAAAIAKIEQELNKALKDTPADSDLRMSMNIKSGIPGREDAIEKKFKRAENKDPQKIGTVAYQPRAVGNDMGLWVMGSAWLDLIQEALPSLYEDRPDLNRTNGINFILLGLGQVILGEPDSALESFSKAVSAGSAELGRLGSAVAWVEKGDENMAISACEETLRVNPKNKTAKDNLKWLRLPSNIKTADGKR